MKSKKSKNKAKPAPPRLSKLEWGDPVAVLLPGGNLAPASVQTTEENLRKEGFCIAQFKRQSRGFHYFSGTDVDRAQDFKTVLSDPSIKAVFVGRAGYGSQRLLEAFRSQKFKPSHPKIIVGYSDLTYLFQWIQNQWGWVGFHGPLVGHLSREQISQFVDDFMCFQKDPRKIDLKSVTISKEDRTKKASGTLVGGALSLLQVAGPAALPKKPLILCIEDVNEAYYRLDRMIWTLIASGYDRFVKGIILGNLHNCGGDQAFLWDDVQTSLRRLCPRGPIWKNAPFGHGLERQTILPLGTRVEMKEKALRILSPIFEKDGA